RGQENEEQTENRETIGDYKVLRVCNRYAEEHCDKHCRAEGGECHSAMTVGIEPDQSHQQLDDRILHRDALVAIAALSAKHQPAQDRDVLARLDLMTAFGAF